MVSSISGNLGSGDNDTLNNTLAEIQHAVNEKLIPMLKAKRFGELQVVVKVENGRPMMITTSVAEKKKI